MFEPDPITPLAAVPDAPEHLLDVAEAREWWERCRDRERKAHRLLVGAVEDARVSGATLAEIAGQLGTTRQYVQKVLREATRDSERESYEAARYSPDNARRALGGLSGWKAGQPQCPGCKSFLASPEDQCGQCGYMPGAGYAAVPAKTSYLERHR